ncbi:MAG TPA: O-antigen ligase family protein, partial [Anaerolineae bacterium]
RWLETLSRVNAAVDVRRRTILIATGVLALVVLALGWVLDLSLGAGTLLVVFILFSFLALLKYLNWRDALLMATYAAILSVQLVAIFFTQSRGPWLGLGGGVFAFVVLYALARGSRRFLFSAIGLAAVAAAFLILFNLPFAPLDPLKRVPYVGRLGEILDPKSPTAQVRELIWQGTIKLILPHAPLWSPTTGDDPFNAIRVLVGYGPEAMYVAFNPFYPPELAHVEARNASPDRAHNETFDSLVMTGLLGFGAYILLFISVFYFGLKWLGVITTPGERNTFIVLWLAGGFLSALIFSLWRGLTFIGVALPAGMILGLFIFLVIDVVRRPRTAETALDVPRALWLSAVFAALIGHFIEIHFGIAIVSTRTYFWFYVALLIIIGLNRLTDSSPMPATVPEPSAMPPQSEPNSPKMERTESARSARRKRRRVVESARAPVRKERANGEVALMPVLAWTAITALIAVTLAYEFMNNQAGVPSALEAVQRSLFFKGDTASPGIFLMLALTWVIAGLIGFGEELKDARLNRNGLGMALALFVVLSLTIFVWYTLFQMRWLTQVGDMTAGFVSVLGLYYISFFILIGALAFCLSFDVFPRGAVLLRSSANAALAPALFLIVLGSVYFSNYTVVSADILYKSGTNLD